MPASQKQMGYIARKLEDFDHERHAFQQAMDSYVGGVTSVARTWLDSQGRNGPSFQELIAVLGTSTGFIIEKTEEIMVRPESGDADVVLTEEAASPTSIVTSPTSTAASTTALPSSSYLSSSSSHSTRTSSHLSENVVIKLQDRLENLENEQAKVRELEERLSRVELERRDKDSKKVEEVEDRLSQLEERTKGLEDQKIEEDFRRNLDAIKTDISAVVTRVDVVEKRQQRGPVGFSVCLTDILTLSKGTIVKEFTKVMTNSGNSYDTTTGIFTAPIDGLYVAAVTHTQCNDAGARQLKVRHERLNPGVGGDKEVLVCESWTELRSSSSSAGVGVVRMTAGDRLYVKGGDWVGEIRWPSSFSCFLIG